MEVFHFLWLELAFDKLRDKSHGAWTVERDQSDDISKDVGLELFGKASHARRLHLEDTGCFAATKHVKDFLVVEREVREVNSFTPSCVDQFNGILQDS